MRDRMLHDSLRALTEDASLQLENLVNSGAEIPFEVGESSHPADARGGVAMFAYRPLTAEFVSSHADQLRSLSGFENAAQNLARTRGVIAYLRVRDEPILDVGELTHARLGVLAFLSAVWQDAERFEQWEERFERAYTELESVVLAERLVTTVFIPVHGVALADGSINLGGGVELVAAEELDPTCADRFSDGAEGADCFCSISVTAPSDAPTPMPAVRQSARVMLTALRLFRPGSVALGMTAQAEVAGSWHQVSVPFTGRSRENAWELRAEDDEELRQFVNAVRRVERRTRISWALKRFEMGLERGVPAEGLTDFMLSLKALLEASGDHGTAALPARVSALCAQENERLIVRDEVEAALALERLAVDGHVGRADRKRLGKMTPLEVIAGVERHLRALLHDLVCGYLSTDLKALADEILTADGEQPGSEIEVEEPVYLEPVPAPGETRVDSLATVEFDVVFDDTAEISAIDARVEPAEAPRGDAGDNVWTLQPAEEIQPAPDVTDEVVDATGEYVTDQQSVEESAPEPTPEMHRIAGDLVDDYDQALAGTMEGESMEFSIEDVADEPFVAEEDVTVVPSWDPTPERRPVTDRRASKDPQPAVPTGFTFDFQPVEAPAPVAERPARAAEAAPLDESSPAFPVPEFGVPLGRGPAAQRSDADVEDSDQRASFREIMDENFQAPARDADEPVSTPVGRDGKPHLVALEPEQPAQRIVHPDVFGGVPSEPEVSKPIHPAAPVDPQLTVEYDVLGAETSAEEAAQLAWSEQFLRKGDDQVIDAEAEPDVTDVVETETETEPEPLPAPRLLPPLRSVPDVVVAKFPEATPEVEPEAHDRTMKIGPATIEFRPVVDSDPDDPDDFCGGV